MSTVAVGEIVRRLLSLYHQPKQRKCNNKNYKDNVQTLYPSHYVGRYIHHYLEIPRVRFSSLCNNLEYLYTHNCVTEVSLKVPWEYLLEHERKHGLSSDCFFDVAAVIDRIELTRNRKNNQVTGIKICEVKTHKSVQDCYTTDKHKYQIRLYALLIDVIRYRYQKIFPHNPQLHRLITRCFPVTAKITLRVNHVEQVMAQRAILLRQNTIYCTRSDTVQTRFMNLRTKLQGLKWTA